MRFIRFPQLKEKGITFTRQHEAGCKRPASFRGRSLWVKIPNPLSKKKSTSMWPAASPNATRGSSNSSSNSNSGRKCLLPFSCPLLALAAREGPVGHGALRNVTALS